MRIVLLTICRSVRAPDQTSRIIIGSVKSCHMEQRPSQRLGGSCGVALVLLHRLFGAKGRRGWPILRVRLRPRPEGGSNLRVRDPVWLNGLG
jgi:hypothetical protein